MVVKKSRDFLKTKSRMKLKNKSRSRRRRSRSRSIYPQVRYKSNTNRYRNRAIYSQVRARANKHRPHNRSTYLQLRSKARINKPIKNVHFKFPVSQTETDYKLIELEGCKFCQDAKNLIKDNKYTLLVKKELSSAESEEIKNKVGSYPYFPKIFKYNIKLKKYEFIGGFDKLKQNIIPKN